MATQVLLPGESHGQRSLVGYRLWGHKESDTTECLSAHLCNLKPLCFPRVRIFLGEPRFPLAQAKCRISRWMVLGPSRMGLLCGFL